MGLLLFFRHNLGSLRGHFIRLAARCLFGVVFLRKAEQGKWLCAVSTLNSPASMNRAPIHLESAKSLRPGQSLISSPFYIRSSNWIIPNTAHAQSVDYLRVGRSMFCHAILITRFPESMFEFTTQHLVIEVPERTLDCSEPKKIPSKTHRNMTRGG